MRLVDPHLSGHQDEDNRCKHQILQPQFWGLSSVGAGLIGSGLVVWAQIFEVQHPGVLALSVSRSHAALSSLKDSFSPYLYLPWTQEGDFSYPPEPSWSAPWDLLCHPIWNSLPPSSPPLLSSFTACRNYRWPDFLGGGFCIYQSPRLDYKLPGVKATPAVSSVLLPALAQRRCSTFMTI